MGKKDPEHLKLVRTYPCCVKRSDCPVVPGKESDLEHFGVVMPHHPIGGGMALKTDDTRAMPLCARHHDDCHQYRGVFRGWTKAIMKNWENRMYNRYKPIKEIF